MEEWYTRDKSGGATCGLTWCAAGVIEGQGNSIEIKSQWRVKLVRGVRLSLMERGSLRVQYGKGLSSRLNTTSIR